MVNKKTIILILATLLIISTLTIVYAERSYSIDEALLDLTVQPNGLLHIKESYNYNFIGTFNGVTRDIPLKSGESIDNLQISAIGAYPSYTARYEDGYLKLKIYLYSDAAHTKKIHDTDVQVFISYDMANVTTVYKDTVSLQYKLWGEGWDVKVGKLTTNIHTPSKSGNMYWLNPSQFNQTSSINGNNINSISTSIPKGKFYELQLLMPLNDFTNSPYARHVDKDAKQEIIKIQENYKNSEIFYNNLYFIIGVLFIISPIIPTIIYFKYGRDPKITYQGIYERNPPTNDPPAMVNSLIQEHASDMPGLKGFEATIMDLINRKIINIETNDNKDKNLTLYLNIDKQDSLDKPDKFLLQLLNRFANNQTLNLQNFKNQLRIESNARYFREQYGVWGRLCQIEYIPNLEHYFIKKGKTLSRYFGIIGIIIGIIFAYMALFNNLPNSFIGLIGSIILIITSIISLFLPNDIFGRWTQEGKEYSEKWKNFKKFLKENSLLNEHPPESIVIWNQYLVYATALGVADNVYKTMKIHIPSDNYYDNDLYLFHTYGGYWMMHDALHTGFSTAANEAASGLGGIGGGSGGGGGGAF